MYIWAKPPALLPAALVGSLRGQGVECSHILCLPRAAPLVSALFEGGHMPPGPMPQPLPCAFEICPPPQAPLPSPS